MRLLCVAVRGGAGGGGLGPLPCRRRLLLCGCRTTRGLALGYGALGLTGGRRQHLVPTAHGRDAASATTFPAQPPLLTAQEALSGQTGGAPGSKADAVEAEAAALAANRRRGPDFVPMAPCAASCVVANQPSDRPAEKTNVAASRSDLARLPKFK